jgi:hypothetical protein
MLNLREGFFKSEAEPELPAARARTKPWRGRRVFLEALAKVQASEKVSKKKFKGASTCRCCGEANGSAEYHLVMGDVLTVVWPQGFEHYVREHNVRPGLMFHDLILQMAQDLE